MTSTLDGDGQCALMISASAGHTAGNDLCTLRDVLTQTAFSAETKQGREDIWTLIDKMAAGEDLLTAEEEIQAEKAAEWAAKKAAKEAENAKKEQE